MKVRLTFKTPDVADYALQELEEDQMFDDENQKFDVEAAIEKYVKNGEYLSVEIDTLSGTATVIPVGE